MVKSSLKLQSMSSTSFTGKLGAAFVCVAMGVAFGTTSAHAGIVDNVTQTLGQIGSGITGSGIKETVEEGGIASLQSAGSSPFNVVVDGVPVFGDASVASSEDDERSVDIALEKMDIAVQVDVEDLDRAANVEAVRRSIGLDRSQNGVQFFTYWNYGAFVETAEVRLFRADDSIDGKPAAIVQINPGQPTVWQISEDYGDELVYVLRLNGKDGNFDETEPKLLKIDETQRFSGDEESFAREALVAYGKNRLTTENINLNGGSVTVSGLQVPEGHRVFVMGVPVPVSQENEFVTREILPVGEHSVVISTLDSTNRGLEFQRNLEIKGSDWFYVGIGDLTVGATTGSGPVELTGIEEGEDNKVDAVGRAAFFVRGKIQGKYLLTALADTTEDELSNLFKNITKRDPSSLLDRIDPDKYYPVYGDDSTVKDLGANQGNLYVKIETGDSHVLWGNYKTQIVGSDLAQVRRSLYGAQLRYHAESQTSFGEKRFNVEAFAAQPQSLPQTDELQGTGGSAYFLKRQDIIVDAEEIRVEVRNPVTGVVLQSRKLVRDEDYQIDYIQGRVILLNPLASRTDDNFIVEGSASDGLPQYLVARYEYVPTLTDFDGYSVGGRAEAWVGDMVRVGGTIHQQDTSYSDKNLYAFDALVRLNAGTYIKGEYALSNSQGDTATVSTDGGFDTIDATNRVSTATEASAFRVEAGVDLKELTGIDGKASAYFKRREAGFSSEGQDTNDEVNNYGATASLPIGGFLNVRGTYDVTDNKTQNTTNSTAKADVDYNINENLKAGVGLGYTVDAAGAGRLDLGGRVGLTMNDYEAYAFAQTTVSKDDSRARNARAGIGGKVKITDRLSVGGEVSGGDGGLGARAKAEFQVSDRTTAYLAYETNTRTNTGTGQADTASVNNSRIGTLTAGGRSRYTDALSVYGEERITHNERGVSELTHAYGVNYAPSDAWKLAATFENGEVENTAGQAIKRTSVGGTAEYKQGGLSIGGGLEARLESNEADGTERTVYLGRAKTSIKFNPSWRLQAQIKASLSEADGTFGDGDFVQAGVGFAYRPVDNDRLNALLKYQAYYDLPGSQQVDSSNARADYKQRSHVLSADAIYELSRNFSVGAKYGLKMGEQTSSRAADDWYRSTIQLGVLRADWHVVKNWDATVEFRALNHLETKTTRLGGLAAIYRHFGDNLKLGVGYNFADVSDDLLNVNANTQGVFVNAISKF